MSSTRENPYTKRATQRRIEAALSAGLKEERAAEVG